MTSSGPSVTRAPDTSLGAYALIGLAMLCMSSNVVIGRAAMTADIAPVGFILFRLAVAALAPLPFLFGLWRRQLPLLLRDWRRVVVLALLFAVFGHALVYVGLTSTTAVNAGLIAATQPVLTVLIAALVLGERVSRRQGLGMAVALAGILAIVARGEWQVLVGLEFVVGDLVLLASMLSFSAYNVAVKGVPPGINPFVMFVAMAGLGSLFLVPVHLVEALAFDLTVPTTWFAAVAIGFTAIVATLFATVLWNVGIRHVGPSRAAVFINLVPIFATALAVAFLGEVLRPYHAAGLVLVMCGVYLVTRGGSPKR